MQTQAMAKRTILCSRGVATVALLCVLWAAFSCAAQTASAEEPLAQAMVVQGFFGEPPNQADKPTAAHHFSPLSAPPQPTFHRTRTRNKNFEGPGTFAAQLVGICLLLVLFWFF